MPSKKPRPAHEGKQAPHREEEERYARPFSGQFRQQLAKDEEELRRHEQ